MSTRPAIPKGTRDLSPLEMSRREYIFDIIRSAFRRYGFLPLETPAMENVETLLGKYGEEGDRLVFRVLNSGNYLSGYTDDRTLLLKKNESFPTFTNSISEKALRYDLTVPFARYVVMHQNEIVFPFKRYQIQPVWRADRPQKGRYREFHQCDADVIGSTSLLNEVELVMLFDDVFTELGLQVMVKMNDRRILSGIAGISGEPHKVVTMVTALDKLDKIGRESVEKELREKGVGEVAISNIAPLFAINGDWKEQREQFERWLAPSDVALQGLKDLDWIFNAVGRTKSIQLEYDPTLARGLDYYTGVIFEVKALEGSLRSSICGGGRYDDLTGIFGLKDMSGVGISFGADRIYDVLLETGKFPEDIGQGARLLFANFGARESLHALTLLRKMRDAGISAELYPDAVKMAKQFKYADDRKIPFVAVIGENEMKTGIVNIKDMRTGEQKAVKEADLLAAITNG
jgi:histidyl-tRNA synthetase